MDELLARGLVHEMGLQPSGGGGLAPATSTPAAAARRRELNDFVLAVLTDFVAHVRWQRRVEFDTLSRIVSSRWRRTYAEALDYNARTDALTPLGIGAGVLGLVQADTGELRLAPNLHWHNLPLQSIWHERYGIPVFVENQATAAALGEHYFGAAKDYADTIFIDASVLGIGAGIVLNGKLFKGSQGFAGEAGHMVVDPNGPLCGCGNRGCWEAVLSSPAIAGRLRERIERGEPSVAVDLVGGDLDELTLETVHQAAVMGDAPPRPC